jgi:hypothetical protein
MAGFDYARMQGTATRLMDRFKQGVVVLRRSAPGTPDPSTPWLPGAPVVTEYPLKAAVRGVSQQYVNGTTILTSDEQVTCAVPSVTPDMATDALVIDGVAVTVLKNQPIPAAGTPVAYLFVIRR